jgi:hypothetical protein
MKSRVVLVRETVIVITSVSLAWYVFTMSEPTMDSDPLSMSVKFQVHQPRQRLPHSVATITATACSVELVRETVTAMPSVRPVWCASTMWVPTMASGPLWMFVKFQVAPPHHHLLLSEEMITATAAFVARAREIATVIPSARLVWCVSMMWEQITDSVPSSTCVRLSPVKSHHNQVS